jgi:hypothetical protein
MTRGIHLVGNSLDCPDESRSEYEDVYNDRYVDQNSDVQQCTTKGKHFDSFLLIAYG